MNQPGACGCQEKEQRFLAVLEAHKGEQGALIPLLQETQEIFGYLSKEAMEAIAEAMGISLAKIYGVATFYAQFHLTPRGENVIRVCLGTACHVRGGAKVLEALEQELGVKAGETSADGRFSLEPVACIGACGLAPVITVNDEAHGKMTPEQVKKLSSEYR